MMSSYARAFAEAHIERIKKVEEIFEAGWIAGHKACYPPVGPPGVPTEVHEAYEKYLEDNLPKGGLV